MSLVSPPHSGRALAVMSDSTEIVADGDSLMSQREAPTAIEAVTRAEIDRQIATAKTFPRSISRFLSDAKTMVASDPDLAAQCTYYLPPRKGSKESITGPSVRLAEIVALCWGNLRIVGRISDDDGRFLTAQAVAIDLEKNVGYSIEVKRGVTTRDGRRYGDDMLKTTSNAAIAIAQRNATFKVVPRAFVNLVEEEAQRVARGDVKSLPDRTARALSWFVGKGIPESRVFDALGIAGAADVTLDLLSRLQGMKVALNEGQASVDELFPLPTPAQAPVEHSPSDTKTEALAKRLKGQKAKTEEAPIAEQPQATLLPKDSDDVRGEGPND